MMGAGLLDHGGAARVLAPVGVALLTLVLMKHAVWGLMAGSLAACLLLQDGHLGLAVKQVMETHFFPSFQGSWRVGAILFTLVLGSFTVLIERGGGFDTLARKYLLSNEKHSGRRLQIATGVLGLFCFFDGLANSLLIGRVTRPLADRVGVARAKMAYLVDSTSSSIACIAFISTWIATQLSLIQQSIEPFAIDSSAYALFFASVPRNYYCWFTLVLLAAVVWRGWDIGPMKQSQAKAQPAQSLQDPGGCEDSRDAAPVWTALVPIGVLAMAIPVLFYLWETQPLFPVTGEKLANAFSGGAGPYAMTLGSVVGLLAAALCFPKRGQGELVSAVSHGAASMLGPLLILVMAWTFGSTLSELGTAAWIASAMGDSVDLRMYPAAVFLTGALVSFATGSSWGTMALMMPIALPAYLGVAGDNPELLSAVIGAVFSGAVFGDHCSPFSDTTIVSAFSCGVSAKEHVLTQLPYAGLAALVALLIGYGGLALNMAAWVNLLIGAAVLVSLVVWSSSRNKSDAG
ncbi:hypothetical protein HW115_17370 [Verrucomicrobiaceae bacterium N1E253]|uniref:Na+/H+ antiporter NhaC-like C-terminal domain-containing protein n=2 Tax=Oceaniferula marina TaxID=2748318 RepID=A0A851GIR7_9BACT|nr:hypothetical protein [Oceaniferula marina]